MDENHRLPLDANSLNAITTAMGGLAYALTLHLSASERAEICQVLQSVSAIRLRAGDSDAAAILLDLAAAVALDLPKK